MAAEYEGVSYPFLWNACIHCTDHGGDIRRFPRGTYHEQTQTFWGRTELIIIPFIRRVGEAIVRQNRNWDLPEIERKTTPEQRKRERENKKKEQRQKDVNLLLSIQDDEAEK